MKIYCNDDVMDKTATTLSQLAGKDVWVRLAHKGMDRYSFYAKIFSVEDFGIMEAAKLPSWWTRCVDGKDLEIDSHDLSNIQDRLSNSAAHYIRDAVDYYYVCTPLDIMTTNEMYEVLDTCVLVED
jgi:hypothetical protein